VTVLDDFLQDVPDGVGKTLAALACAESLTDEVARVIYRKVPVPGLSAEQFLSAFKYSGLTEPRNSEWNLNGELRNELVRSKYLPSDARRSVHRYLMGLGSRADLRHEAGRTVPTYLFSEAGLAYHLAGSGDTAAALEHYGRASLGPFNGAQWLGAKLVEEQEQTGAIPRAQIETTFLRAWVMLRQGRKKEAMPLFAMIAEADANKREVAISLHLIGNDLPPRRSEEAEAKLRRSIEINSSLDNRFGVAQTLHSLGNLLSRQDRRWDEAEKAYRESIEMLRSLGDRFGEAQTLHSFGNLLSRQDRRRNEAEKAYRESIEIGRRLDNRFHVAQTLHSLGNLLTRQDRRRNEAERIFEESLELGERLQRDKHIAQVLRSYALAIERRDPDKALDMLGRALEIDERQGNQRYASIVRQTIQQVRKRTGR